MLFLWTGVTSKLPAFHACLAAHTAAGSGKWQILTLLHRVGLESKLTCSRGFCWSTKADITSIGLRK